MKFVRLAALCMYLSGIFAFFGIIFLTLLYIGLFTGQANLYIFGPLNDVFTIFHFALTIPAAFSLHQYFRVVEPGLCRIALGTNLVGVTIVVVFQTLLVTGMMSFIESLGMVLIGGVLFGVWILTIGILARKSGALPLSRRLSMLAVFYIGYPVWAFRVGRFLGSRESGTMVALKNPEKAT